MNLVSDKRSMGMFWQGKRVLITGHTGFKGSWLAIWLQRLGAEVVGLSLPPATTPSLYELADCGSGLEHHICDVRDRRATGTLIKAVQPDILFHLAAQSLVRTGYRDVVETFDTNIMGTVHVLDALRDLGSVRVAVMVTTDKVYRNHEWPWPYRETDILGGYDPYSASKAASESVIASYRDAFLKSQGVAIASARAGNVIGGGDWSEDRLIPDAVRVWQVNGVLEVRRPDAIRPWQHVLEPLHGYLRLAESIWEDAELAGAYNFGPLTHEAATVREVVELAMQSYGGGNARYCDGVVEGPHEAGWLALEVAKARTLLSVRPRWGLQETVRRTMNWYRRQHDGTDARRLCDEEIDAYERAL